MNHVEWCGIVVSVQFATVYFIWDPQVFLTVRILTKNDCFISFLEHFLPAITGLPGFLCLQWASLKLWNSLKVFLINLTHSSCFSHCHQQPLLYMLFFHSTRLPTEFTSNPELFLVCFLILPRILCFAFSFFIVWFWKVKFVLIVQLVPACHCFFFFYLLLFFWASHFFSQQHAACPCETGELNVLERLLQPCRSEGPLSVFPRLCVQLRQ